jgi:hypothetical protein
MRTITGFVEDTIVKNTDEFKRSLPELESLIGETYRVWGRAEIMRFVPPILRFGKWELGTERVCTWKDDFLET